MTSADPRASSVTDRALKDVMDRWTKAMACLCASTLPPWKRTQNALLCFKGLAFDPLPEKLQRRIDRTFARINKVLAGYSIVTWDDYKKISPADLAKIEKLLQNIV